MSAVGAATVGIGTALVLLAIFALVIVGGLLAVRRQNRMFPKGFDRTGWTPERGRGLVRNEVHVARRRTRLSSASAAPAHARYAAARSANFAYRRRNESFTVSVGPLRCFARMISAIPCCSDSSPR